MYAVRRQWRSWGRVAGLVCGLYCAALPPLFGAETALAEYQVKAAYLYNFISFTEWPETPDTELRLCVYGPDPFGDELDALHGKGVGGRRLTVVRISTVELLDGCHAAFLTSDVISNLPRILDQLRNRSVLTIADSPGAAVQGVAINMRKAGDRVVFDVNLDAVHAQGLSLSYRLLRLAEEVIR
ncbi:MAG: YfiR family protein [Gammaproteobacteria bacterium]